jgi:hypothetical protein
VSLIKDIDYGTPESPLDDSVHIEIDGLPAKVRAGTTILRAAREHGVEMILTIETVAHVSQADGAGHVLQLAIAVRRAGQAIQGVVGNIQFHYVASEACDRFGLRADLHAGLDPGRAGRRVTIAALDLDDTQTAGTERLQAVRCT